MNPFDTVDIQQSDPGYSADRAHSNGAYLMMGRMKPPSDFKSVITATTRSFGADLRKDNVETQASVTHGHKHRRVETDSIKSGSSQEDIIRKDVVWEITHDPLDVGQE